MMIKQSKNYTDCKNNSKRNEKRLCFLPAKK